MTKSEFLKSKKIVINIDGQQYELEPREFSTGSVGFRIDQKVPYTLPDGTKAELSVGGNLVLIGSKKMAA
jgi:hypothetical protein